MRFDDYHRTIVGYHGTRLSVALEIVQCKQPFNASKNSDDWLGHGVYFWEYGPQQALEWAKRRKKRQGWDEPIAVVASMIRLGFCLDLLDPFNVKYLEEFYLQLLADSQVTGNPLPKNRNHRKFLDCAIFEYTYAVIERLEGKPSVDSARAVYVPTGDEKRIWERSWISKAAHIQVCVRNQACILGTWLHHVEDATSESDNDIQENQGEDA